MLDGAMGTALQARDLTAEDFGGPELEGCNENLVRTRPDVVDARPRGLPRGRRRHRRDQHLRRHAARARRVRARGRRVRDQRRRGAHRPRRRARHDRPASPASSRLDGPDDQGHLGHRRRHLRRAGGELPRAGRWACSRAASTTCSSRPARTRATSRPACSGSSAAFAEAGWRAPGRRLGTIEPMGTMLAGQAVEALAASLAHADLLYLGLNCATGPEFMTDHLRTLAELCALPRRLRAERRPAGRERPLPRDAGDASRASLARFVDAGWLNLVGGCCGTTRGAHRGARRARRRPARRAPSRHHRRALGLRASSRSRSPTTTGRVIVGERTNVIGSRKFKQLIVDGRAGGRGRDRPRAGQGRARRSSTSAWQTPTATRSRTSTGFLDRWSRRSRCR